MHEIMCVITIEMSAFRDELQPVPRIHTHTHAHTYISNEKNSRHHRMVPVIDNNTYIVLYKYFSNTYIYAYIVYTYAWRDD